MNDIKQLQKAKEAMKHVNEPDRYMLYSVRQTINKLIDEAMNPCDNAQIVAHGTAHQVLEGSNCGAIFTSVSWVDEARENDESV